MDTTMLLVRVRELQKQTFDVYQPLSTEQAALRRQFVVALYHGLQEKLAHTGQPHAADFLQLVIDDITRAD
ncbi:MAG: hypothetical protein JKY70_02425 [Mucilaginibacter sp.]|nr:hypothetical protein [Mucilaginibacter sp.]